MSDVKVQFSWGSVDVGEPFLEFDGEHAIIDESRWSGVPTGVQLLSYELSKVLDVAKNRLGWKLIGVQHGKDLRQYIFRREPR